MISMVAGMRIAGRFILEQPASSGAMGTIFRARDMQTGQRVALKLLHSAGSSPQSATRLEVEAEVLSRLRHPHIVSYVAHGRTQSGLPFLAMEWLDGEDLDHRLRRSLLSVPECYKLLLGVGSALADAHRCGVTHRDIKPSKIAGYPARLQGAEVEALRTFYGQIRGGAFFAGRRTETSREQPADPATPSQRPHRP